MFKQVVGDNNGGNNGGSGGGIGSIGGIGGISGIGAGSNLGYNDEDDGTLKGYNETQHEICLDSGGNKRIQLTRMPKLQIEQLLH